MEATATGRTDAARRSVLDVTLRVWRVLAFDGRPAYAATFVRRALETDARFSQVTTAFVSSPSQRIRGADRPAPASPQQIRARSTAISWLWAQPMRSGPVKRRPSSGICESAGAVVLLPEGTETTPSCFD
ncbi:MAG: hypothetical protein IPL75_12885 [Acidobacteria bacterium]|nr:hypothetical protein [Acidobacteriota bacterium]